MTNRPLQGWSTDPFQLHEQRYFSAGRATKLVRDGTIEAYDEPPSEFYAEADAEADAGADWSGPGPAAAPGRPAGRAPRPGGAAGRYPRDPDAAPGVSKRSMARLLVAATMIVAGTILGLVVLVGQSHPPAAPNQPGTAPTQGQAPASSPVAFVRQSAERTLAERTADLVLSGTVQAAGRTLPVNGTGVVDFGTNAMALTMTVSSGGGQPLVEKEILVNGNLFLALNISGSPLARLTGGREWIQMPAPQSGSANQVGTDPSSSLSLLEQPGIYAQLLGTRSIEGVSCTGYAVTPTKAALLAAVRTYFAKLGFSPAVTQQELSLAQQMLPPTITVWLDAQGMVREMGVKVGVQVSGSGSAATGDVVVDFSNYGSPVHVSAPAPSDTISYSSFLRALGLKT